MKKKFYLLFVLLVLAYLVSFFVEVPDPDVLAKYNLNRADVLWLNMTAALPLVAIWFAGFYGLVKLRHYAKKIKNSPDGEAFKFLEYGLFALVIGLPLTAVISRWLVNAVNADLVSRPVFTVIDTHLNVLYPLIGFSLILVGARRLIKTVKRAHVPTWQKINNIIFLTSISIVYLFLVFTNTDRETTFRVPDVLILLTIALPYLAMLTCGFLALTYLGAYRKHVGGKLYKKSLKKINIGLMFVILAFSLIQFILAASATLSNSGFAWILGLIYVLLILLAIGHICIARGAKGLTKIEEAV